MPVGVARPVPAGIGGCVGDLSALEELFHYNGSGVMPGRIWVIAPDAESLQRRWQKLISTRSDQKEDLFHPHLRGGRPGDKHTMKGVARGLPGYEPRPTPIAQERGPCVPPVRYGFRSFDRQWIIPDNRLINQPNPELWALRSQRQVYLTAPADRSPSAGPALTFTALVPDLHHYNGRGGARLPALAESTSRPTQHAAQSADLSQPQVSQGRSAPRT